MFYYRRLNKYKYQLTLDYSRQVKILPAKNIITKFIMLSTDGMLLIKNNYAWDGASGPAIDTKNFMLASLVHDALCQLIQTRMLDKSHQKAADKLLRKICLEQGMSRFRAWYVYYGVRGYQRLYHWYRGI